MGRKNKRIPAGEEDSNYMTDDELRELNKLFDAARANRPLTFFDRWVIRSNKEHEEKSKNEQEQSVRRQT